MRELVPGPPLGGPSTSTAGTTPGSKEQIQAQEAAFKAAWEAMLVEGMDGMVPPAAGAGGSEFAGAATAGKKEGGAAGKKDFQAGIRAAVDKLKESESAMKVCVFILVCQHYDTNSSDRILQAPLALAARTHSRPSSLNSLHPSALIPHHLVKVWVLGKVKMKKIWQECWR